MLVSVQTKQKNTSASAFENAGNGSLDLTSHVPRLPKSYLLVTGTLFKDIFFH
jgi:hypothetical protein